MKLLVSACLLGEACRYDGRDNRREDVIEFLHGCEVIPVCPEVEGGLPTPRVPAERRGNRVVCRDGADCTEAFQRGVQRCLRHLSKGDISGAILKSRSPSCAVYERYDGCFTRRLVEGKGLFAEALHERGILLADEFSYQRVFCEGNVKEKK
ncbi:MAG: DUF523 domain-containing protein [Ndongobacter sp.]|nr:DUF523 domain-containing protein [Ndongobacter sp.]